MKGRICALNEVTSALEKPVPENGLFILPTRGG